MSFKHLSCRSRTSKRHHILIHHMIKNPIGRSANKLKRAFWKNSRRDDFSYDRFSKIACQSCRFYDCRNSCKKVHCYFFKHSPNRKVKGINMNSYTLLRNTNVMPYKTSPFGNSLHLTINVIRKIRKLTAKGGVRKKVSNSSFNINP